MRPINPWIVLLQNFYFCLNIINLELSDAI